MQRHVFSWDLATLFRCQLSRVALCTVQASREPARGIGNLDAGKGTPHPTIDAEGFAPSATRASIHKARRRKPVEQLSLGMDLFFFGSEIFYLHPEAETEDSENGERLQVGRQFVLVAWAYSA